MMSTEDVGKEEIILRMQESFSHNPCASYSPRTRSFTLMGDSRLLDRVH